MIVTLTTFALSKPATREDALATFKSTAPKYREVPGLLRKHYVVSDDGMRVGGIYFWQSRAHAEALYTESWREFVRGKYGTEPSVTWFDSPLVVDNELGRILVEG